MDQNNTCNHNTKNLVDIYTVDSQNISHFVYILINKMTMFQTRHSMYKKEQFNLP